MTPAQRTKRTIVNACYREGTTPRALYSGVMNGNTTRARRAVAKNLYFKRKMTVTDIARHLYISRAGVDYLLKGEAKALTASMKVKQEVDKIIDMACARQDINRELFFSSRRYASATRARREVAKNLHFNKNMTHYAVAKHMQKTIPAIKHLTQ